MLATYDRADAFSDGECDALIRLAEARGGATAPAPVYGHGGAAQIRTDMRSAQSLLLARDSGQPWLWERLDRLFAEGAAAFGTQVDPVFEPAQLVRYNVGDHFQMWHSDAGTDRLDARRISMSVELADPETYEGGLLEIAPARMLPQRAPPRGYATLFPSRALHRVTAVRSGTRWALVAWTGLNAT